jgi:leader peptidase (prepilin peptidase)/N-methyltransferase
MKFLLIFIAGLIFGSFMNVCIYRLPRGLSIMRPGSMCPNCHRPIKPIDNIPVLSFLFLRGRCRYCGERIHWRYPLVEFLNGLLWVIALSRSFSIPVLLFLSSLVIITFIDMEHMIIPDIITIPGTFSGILLSPFIIDPFLRYERLGFMASLTGAITGFLLFLIIAKAGTWIFKKEAMGGGDIKLMAMVGAFTGWKGVLLTTFLGSIIGSIVGIIILIQNKGQRDTIIPFGPYLAFGAIVSILFGSEVMFWVNRAVVQ